MVARMQQSANEPGAQAEAENIKLEVRDLSISYGNDTALGNTNLEIREH